MIQWDNMEAFLKFNKANDDTSTVYVPNGSTYDKLQQNMTLAMEETM